MKPDPAGIWGESARGAVGFSGGAQVVGSADPHTALERLKANADGFGFARGLGAARDLAVGQIRLDQIDQRGAGFARVRRGQRMREDAGLDLVAASGVAEHGTLETVEHHQYRT